MNVATALRSLTPRKTFFELMRRIDASQRARSGAKSVWLPRRPAWLHVAQAASMNFASTEVSEVTVLPPAFGEPQAWPDIQVVQRHFGLFAPYGPMPLHFTEHAMLEKRFERNPAFEHFLNLLSSDMAWLHYRAWSAMHPVLGHERARHPFVERVRSLSQGRAAASPLGPEKGDRDAFICRGSWPGLYAAAHRPLPALQRLLRTYFRVPIATLPRGGRWLNVPVGRRQARDLGRWRLGSRVWDAHSTLDIEVGPLDEGGFHQWRRRSPAVQALVGVVADYAGGLVHPSVHVTLRTRPEMAGRIGRMRVGVDAWATPGTGLRRFTVHESFQHTT